MGVPGFQKISVFFKIDRRSFSGVGIASASGIFLIILEERRRNVHLLPWGIWFGAIGGVIGALMSRREVSADLNLSVGTCPVKNLPLEFRKHPDWPFPFTAKMEGHQVLWIPRERVEVIRHPSFTNL